MDFQENIFFPFNNTKLFDTFSESFFEHKSIIIKRHLLWSIGNNSQTKIKSMYNIKTKIANQLMKILKCSRGVSCVIFICFSLRLIKIRCVFDILNWMTHIWYNKVLKKFIFLAKNLHFYHENIILETFLAKF